MAHSRKLVSDIVNRGESGLLTLRMEIDLGGETVANRWYTHGNELWEFDEEGYMRRRDASIDDYRIEESERRILP